MATTKIEALPVSSLVEDMDLYPRHAVDSSNVQSLAAALESGANLPPIVADAKSKIIIDGWHRVRAYRKVLGAEAVVDVELVSFRNKAEMIQEAVARNVKHGRRLDKIDLTRSVLMLENAGVPTSKISVLMQMPEAKVEKLKIRVATVGKGTDGAVPGTSKITLKRPVAHFEGKKMTKEQAETHKMLPGTSFLLVAKQLTNALIADMVNLQDDKLIEQLMKLQSVLTEKLSGGQAAA